MPAWEGENPVDPISNQGLKPMYRDSSRRYYLHGRAFINHPDLIFFRAHQDVSIPPLTWNESVTFTTAVAFQGGLVKIGDRIVDLSTEAVDGYRRIMPVYGKVGRPLDMFRRQYPEVWSLPVEDFDEPYHAIGLLNWGSNLDMTEAPFSDIPDEARTIEVDLEEAGLDPSATYLAYEFWQEEFIGSVTGELSLEVPARTPRVVLLHEPLDRPQFLGTNRHVLGGVKVIQSIAWNQSEKMLTGAQEGSIGTEHAPFLHHLAFFVPDGYTFDEADFDVPEDISVNDLTTELTDAQGGKVLDISFTLEDTDGLEQGDQFPQITWTLSFE